MDKDFLDEFLSQPFCGDAAESLPDVSTLGNLDDLLYVEPGKLGVLDGTHGVLDTALPGEGKHRLIFVTVTVSQRAVIVLFLDSSVVDDWLSETLVGDTDILLQQPAVAVPCSLSSAVLEYASSSRSTGELSPSSLGDCSSSVISGPQSPNSKEESRFQFQILPAFSPSERHIPVMMGPPNNIPQEQEYQQSSKPGKVTVRKERKRVQNRDAATRYRVKKKTEQVVLDNRVDILQRENEQLEEKATRLFQEVTILKNLWEDIQKAERM